MVDCPAPRLLEERDGGSTALSEGGDAGRFGRSRPSLVCWTTTRPHPSPACWARSAWRAQRCPTIRRFLSCSGVFCIAVAYRGVRSKGELRYLESRSFQQQLE